MRALSIDLPWAANRNLGAAVAEVAACGTLTSAPLVTSIDLTSTSVVPPPPLPTSAEIEGFIDHGAGLECLRPEDAHASVTSATRRRAYLEAVWGGLHRVAAELELGGSSIDILLLDVPFVPGALARSASGCGRTARYRPVELAFQSKTSLTGSPAIQFPKFQPGVRFGWRPGYALADLARTVFPATCVVESFPQLSLAALADFARSTTLTTIARLTAHKKGNQGAIRAGQATLEQLFEAYLGVAPAWTNRTCPPRARADGYDALLGILPGLVLSGYAAPGPVDSPWRRAVRLRNFAYDAPPVPTSAGAGKPARGCRPWLEPMSAPRPGIDDGGIASLDTTVWQ